MDVVVIGCGRLAHSLQADLGRDGQAVSVLRADEGLPLQLANARAVVRLVREPVARAAAGPGAGASTEALLDAIRALPAAERPAALLSLSSMNVFDGCAGALLDESAAAGQTALAQAAAALEAATLRAEELYVRTVLLRPAVLLPARPPLASEAESRRRPISSGDGARGLHWLSWIALPDAVALIRRAIDGWDISGAFHLVSPVPLECARPSPLTRPYAVWPGKALAASYGFGTNVDHAVGVAATTAGGWDGQGGARRGGHNRQP